MRFDHASKFLSKRLACRVEGMLKSHPRGDPIFPGQVNVDISANCRWVSAWPLYRSTEMAKCHAKCN